MNNRYLTACVGLVLLTANMNLNALALGRFEQNLLGGLQGSIIIKLERANEKLDVQIRGIKEYDLVAVPDGARILIRNGKKVDDTFTVIVKYGNKEARREYSASGSAVPSNSYIVKKGEGLSNVSEAIKGTTGGTFYQRAMALVSVNLDVFKGNDINNIKEGDKLNLPQPEAVTAIAPSKAYEQYRRLTKNAGISIQAGEPKTTKEKKPNPITSPTTVVAIAVEPAQDVLHANNEQVEKLDQMIEQMQMLIAALPKGKSQNNKTVNTKEGE